MYFSKQSQMWNKGGALIHRVRAMGYMAETGARSIAEGRTAIDTETTFKDMRILNREMYDGTIGMLYPYVGAGIFSV